MARKIPHKKKRAKRKLRPEYLLDVLNVQAIRKGRSFGEKIAKLYWELHCELAYQRSQATDEINKWATSATAGPFEFSDWRRVVRFQFSNDPLSTEGSVKGIGGRFNIGDIDVARFPIFPALYAANDQATALAETFGQPKTVRSDISSLDLALASNEPYSCVTLNGRLDEIIDLRVSDVLHGLAEINKSFTISETLKSEFKSVSWPQDIIPSSEVMLKSILDESWRIYPMQFDVPSNSQILGQIIAGCGIQGIVYSSTRHSGDCLAIFPQNFSNTDSFVELTGDLPEGVVVRRLDSSVTA
jgi:hypothetical protein